jgi:hypothetical protein
MKRMKLWLGMGALGLALTACGNQPLASTKYAGPPLATISGQLSLPPGQTQSAPVLLALAWYNESVTATAPNSILTQDVAYQGSFPANYTFNLTQPPPAGSLAPVGNGGAGNFAYGRLLAYQDGNGNGTLDTIPFGGPVVDKVLGASAPLFTWYDTVYEVYYADGDIPADWPAGAQRGFNLVKSGSANGKSFQEVVPFSTQVPIVLSGENELAALICLSGNYDPDSGTYTGAGAVPNPIGYCGLPATPNKLRTFGTAGHEMTAGAPSGDWVYLQLSDGVNWISNASVQFNGMPVPVVLDAGYVDAPGPFYELDNNAGTLLQPGATDTVTINAPGFPPVTWVIQEADQVRLTTPGNNSTVSTAQPLTISWNNNAPGNTYWIDIEGQTGHWSAVTTSSSVTMPPDSGVSGTGSITLNVSGAGQDDIYGSYVNSESEDTVNVTFTP